MKRAYIIFILVLSALLLTYGCRSMLKGQRQVPTVINIDAANLPALSTVDLNYYGLKLRDELDNYLNVRLQVVNPDENPEVILNVYIENFNVWPVEQQVSRRVVSRTVQIGKDAQGRPIFQAVRASVDFVRVQQRSNAIFRVDLQFKGNPARNLRRNFSSNYTYSNSYVDNIQGDPRALDPNIYFFRNQVLEPTDVDFLLALSKRDMLDQISARLRSYFK